MKLRKLTAQQRAAYAAVKRLKVMTVTPRDARPLKALRARGLIRYARDEFGTRLAIYRGTAATRRVQRRTKRRTRTTLERVLAWRPKSW